MAKGKYIEWLEPDKLTLLEAWARDGLTDEDIAKKIGINRATLYEWKKKFPHINDALKKGKEVVDVIVENALLKKALGYNAIVKKAIKVKKPYFDDEGRRIDAEEVVVVEEEIHVPADTTAQIFWLKNRKPKTWRDKQEAEPQIDIQSMLRNIQTMQFIAQNPVDNRNIEELEL